MLKPALRQSEPTPSPLPPPNPFPHDTDATRQAFERKIEAMAQMEHGRWNIERLSAGWRAGKVRDNDQQIHDGIVSWQQLPETIKNYDRMAIQAFPTILAKAGLEIGLADPA